MLGGLSEGEPRESLTVLHQEQAHLPGSDACVLAKRPADGLSDEEILFVHGQETKPEQALLIAVLFPFELMQQGRAA